MPRGSPEEMQVSSYRTTTRIRLADGDALDQAGEHGLLFFGSGQDRAFASFSPRWHHLAVMIRFHSVLLALSGMLLFTSCDLQQSTMPAPEVADLIKAQLDEDITHAVAEYSRDGAMVGAVTLVARDREVLHLQAHGVKSLETQEPVETDTIFRIHSFTKAMTSAAALMLYEQGKYHFDDPISKWLPEFAEIKVKSTVKGERPTAARSSIKVGQLFTHTSGLGYEHFDDLKKSRNLDEMSQRLATLPLAFEPGSDWRYGVSTDLLGRLIEVWSGQSYADYLDQQLIQPLGMVDTAFFVPAEKQERLISIYQSSGKDETDFVMADAGKRAAPSNLPTFCSPGGGLFSTITDYYQFLGMIANQGEWLGKRYLDASSVALMTTNQVPSEVGWVSFGEEIRDGMGFGYGFNVVAQESKFDSDARVGECGWGGLASCHYWFDPESKLVVITLEQILPYRWSLERVVKPVVYQHY